MKKILIVITSLLLVIIIGVSFFYIINKNRSEDTIINEQINEMRDQVAPYEEELYNLEASIRKKAEWTKEKVFSPQIMIGFMPSTMEHFEQIELLSKEHTFYPVIVLDSSVKNEVKLQILEKAQKNNYEVVLTEHFDKKNPDFTYVEHMRSLLPQYGFPDDVIFLLREDSDSFLARHTVIENGYSGLLLYNEKFVNGIFDEQIPYGNYYYLRDNSYLKEVLYDIAHVHAVVILIVDFSSVEDGTTREEEIPGILTYLEHLKDEQTFEFSTVKNAFDVIVETDRIRKERQKEYDDFVKGLQPRMDELQAKLNELYAGFVN